MKKLEFIVLVLGLALGACNKPVPVELLPEQPDDFLEVSSIAPSDSNLAGASVDSSAMLPGDQERFAGQLQLVHVIFDGGQRLIDTSYTRVVFENRLRPIRVSGRVIGFHGINLGPVRLNGTFLAPIPHRLGRRDSVAGIEYVRGLSAGEYQPRTSYTWTAAPDSVGPISVSIYTPEDIVVHHPVGGTVIRRDRNLPLMWSGQGDLFIVISSYEPVLRMTRPLLSLKVRNNIGRAVLNRKFLQLLPPQRIYVLTFVLVNRNESEIIQRFPERVLVQAASIYNSYVELR